MPKSQYVDFKSVKTSVTMEQVLQHYGLLEQMKRSGDSLSGCCPLHGGTNSTQFRVSISKNCWNCFSECKCGGNVLDFVAKKERITVHAAATKLCEWFQLPMEDNRTAVASRPPRPWPPPKLPPSSPAIAVVKEKPKTEDETVNPPLKFRLEHLDVTHPYLTERGLTPETLMDFGLGHCAKGMMAGRIAIPINDPEGRIVAYAGRWPGEPPGDVPKYKLPPGFRKSLELFNLDRATQEPSEKPLVIVEGFFGAMKLYQHGCRKVVALMGSSLSAAQEGLIRKHTAQSSRVVLMLDEDEAGRLGREDIAVRLAKFVFVRIHVFDRESAQPENLTAEQISAALEGL